MSRIKTKYIEGNAVTNAKLAQMAQSTIKGRAASSGTGDPVDLSATQATAILDTFTGDSGSGGLKGLVPGPASGDAAAGKFLKADGTWAVASGSSTPTIFGSRGTPRSIVAATGITSGASHMSTSAASQDIYVEGSISGDSVAATISAGTIDGQRMTLIGRNNNNTVTLNGTTTNVSINGPVTLGADDIINLRWDTTNWVETSRNG